MKINERVMAFIFWVITVLPNAFSQKYDVVGAYKGLSAQGMAISDGRAYLLNHKGLCRPYSLKGKNVIGEYRLKCFDENNHANCASFGVERYKGLPLLYISQCRRPTYHCYVESVTDKGSKTLQVITPKCKGDNRVAHDWIVDKRHKKLYTVTTTKVLDANSGRRLFHIVKFRLPKISEGSEITLTDEDVLDDFYFEYSNILQGGVIKGNRLYLPMGVGKKRKGGELGRTLLVVNLKKKQIDSQIPMEIDDEPEDCDFYKGKLILFCGQSGGLFEIRTK